MDERLEWKYIVVVLNRRVPPLRYCEIATKATVGQVFSALLLPIGDEIKLSA